MSGFFCGIILMGSWTASLFYFRFWKTTKDRLFLIFSFTFFCLGIDRIALMVMEPKSENRPIVFLIRLLSFLVLIWGIWQKNKNLSSETTTGD